MHRRDAFHRQNGREGEFVVDTDVYLVRDPPRRVHVLVVERGDDDLDVQG
jgi:hypothetical protein